MTEELPYFFTVYGLLHCLIFKVQIRHVHNHIKFFVTCQEFFILFTLLLKPASRFKFQLSLSKKDYNMNFYACLGFFEKNILFAFFPIPCYNVFLIRVFFYKLRNFILLVRTKRFLFLGRDD